MNLLFNRNSKGPLSSEGLTSLQGQVDGLVGAFAEQATDWRSLAAMTAGGLAYRTGRLGLAGIEGGSALRAASVGGGLMAEVSAFEMSHRVLKSQNSNLWRWNGNGGLRQGLLQSLITFGTLKGAARLAQNQNFLVQHLLQDSAMVAGHRASAWLGMAPAPQGGLAEQFLHAEATNLGMGAGLAWVHALAPGLGAMERGLSLSTEKIPLSGRAPFLPGEIKKAAGLMGLGLFTSGCDWVSQAGEKFQSADPLDRLIVGIVMATGAVGLYHLYKAWFENRIETHYHYPRPGESHLNTLRLLEDPRETFYRPVALGEIRRSLLVANAIFANATHLEVMSPSLLLSSHRIFDLFFDPRTGELKEAFELIGPQPYYPPPEIGDAGLLHARIGRLIDLNQFADFTGEPILAFSLAQTEGPYRISDYQIAFQLRDLLPRASRRFNLPYEGDLGRLVAGPNHSPMGPLSIDRESGRFILRGATDGEELAEDLSFRFLTRNGSRVSFDGVRLRPLDSIQYDGITFRFVPPRIRNALEEYSWLRWAPGLARLRKTFMDSKQKASVRDEALNAYVEGLKAIPPVTEFLEEERKILAEQWRKEFERSLSSGMLFYHRALNAIDEKLHPSTFQEEMILNRQVFELNEAERKVQSDNELILQGDRETLKRLGVFYASQDESISGNARLPNHYAVNLYVDSDSGGILALGNPQYLPMERFGRRIEVTIRVLALPEGWATGKVGAFEHTISTVEIKGQGSASVKRIWGGMIGKPFHMLREDYFPEEDSQAR